MAYVIVKDDAGNTVGTVTIDGHHGPWTDDWQQSGEYQFSELVNQAVRAEGGE